MQSYPAVQDSQGQERLPAPPGFLGEADILRAFLGDRSPHTVRAYESDLADFARFLGAADVPGALRAFLGGGQGGANRTVLAYRSDLLGRGLSTATAARRVAAVKSIVKLARMLGAVSWTVDVQAPKVEQRQDRRGPDRGAFRMLWREAVEAGDGPQGRRDRAIVSLLYDLGLRRGEVAALDVDDVGVSGGGTVAVLGKGRREKTQLDLPGPTARALADWLEARGPGDGPLFTRLDNASGGDPERLSDHGIGDVVSDLGRRAGISGRVRPHGLRHSAVTRVWQEMGPAAATEFARHSDPRVTMRYVDRHDGRARAAEMLAGER